MAPMRKQSVWKLAITLALLPVLAGALWAEKQATHAVRGGATLAATIPVGPLGFVPPNPTYLSHRFSFTSLDFIDKDHLLFTFHVNTLLPRIPGDPAA